jgi:hypothetical protein
MPTWEFTPGLSLGYQGHRCRCGAETLCCSEALTDLDALAANYAEKIMLYIFQASVLLQVTWSQPPHNLHASPNRYSRAAPQGDTQTHPRNSMCRRQSRSESAWRSIGSCQSALCRCRPRESEAQQTAHLSLIGHTCPERT